jgi:hypothetical protein
MLPEQGCRRRVTARRRACLIGSQWSPRMHARRVFSVYGR